MSSYNLNEKVGDDYFEFSIDDFKYKMRYPSSQDMLDVSDMTSKIDETQAKIAKLQEQIIEADAKEAIKLRQELAELNRQAKDVNIGMIDWCMNYIEPITDNAPNFKETILKKQFKYLRNFMKMIEVELGQ